MMAGTAAAIASPRGPQRAPRPRWRSHHSASGRRPVSLSRRDAAAASAKRRPGRRWLRRPRRISGQPVWSASGRKTSTRRRASASGLAGHQSRPTTPGPLTAAQRRRAGPSVLLDRTQSHGFGHTCRRMEGIRIPTVDFVLEGGPPVEPVLLRDRRLRVGQRGVRARRPQLDRSR